MTEERATGNKVSGMNIDYGVNGRQVLGKTEELGCLVCKFNTEDQAVKYPWTTEVIADYVGAKCGRNMRMLVKQGRETMFTEPKPPRKDESTQGPLEKFKMELTIFHKDSKEHKDQKSKAFVIIMGQCSQAVKSKVENDMDFQELEKNDDVVGLLNKLREFAFSAGGVQHPHWTLQKVVQDLTCMSQGPKEMVQNCHKRFLALTKVIEAQWGEFSPPGLVADATAAETKKA